MGDYSLGQSARRRNRLDAPVSVLPAQPGVDPGLVLRPIAADTPLRQTLSQVGTTRPTLTASNRSAVPAGTSFDLSGAMKELGITPDIISPTDPNLAQVSDLQSRINDLAKQIETARGDLAAKTDPFAQVKVANSAQRAQTDAELAALAASPPVKAKFTPYTPDAPYPTMPTLPIPERPEAHVNPGVAALTAIGSVLAPTHAANFTSSAVQGAIIKANQTLQDSLRTRGLQLEQLEQQHRDELNARNEAIRYAEENLRGTERTDYLNAIANRDYELAKGKLGAAKAGEEATAKGYAGLTVDDKARQEAIAHLDALQSNRNDMIRQIDALQKGEEARQKMKVGLLEAIARIQESKAQHEETRAHNQEMEQAARDRIDQPRSVAPGAVLLDPQTNQPIYTNPHTPVPYSYGQGLRDPNTGKVITPALPPSEIPGKTKNSAADLLKQNPRYAALDRDEKAQTASLRSIAARISGALKGNIRFQAMPPDQAAAYVQTLVDQDPTATEIKKVIGNIQREKQQILDATMQKAGATTPTGSIGTKGTKGKTLDAATAAQLFQEAGRNPERARALAKQRGYIIPAGQ